MSRIILIGANHAGIAAANTILDNYTGHELVVFERNSNISYLGCGTALWVGRQIDGTDGLFYSSAEELRAKGATVYMETNVDRVDFQAKKVIASALDGGEIIQDYDQLILATGSLPVSPGIAGTDLGNVQFVKRYQDGRQADACLGEAAVNDVVVVGAGYIGVEIAEAAKRRGKNVTLIETASGPLGAYYDPWMANDMRDVLDKGGIRQRYGEKVRELWGDGAVRGVVTDKGEYPADMVILSLGFRPDTALGAGGIELFSNGAYYVNLRQQTSLPGVYAIGDCATVFSNALQETTYIALATNAVRSGIIAGHNVCGTPLESVGVQGSNGISIFGYNMVSAGLTAQAAQAAGFDAEYTDYEDLQKPAFITEDNHNVKIRIVYAKKTRRILGAQLASYNDISMGIHMFSLAIEEKVTIDKLKLLDIFFLPHFNQPYNYITMAALGAK